MYLKFLPNNKFIFNPTSQTRLTTQKITLLHLADAFIQSDLQCTQNISSVCIPNFPGIRPTTGSDPHAATARLTIELQEY